MRADLNRRQTARGSEISGLVKAQAEDLEKIRQTAISLDTQAFEKDPAPAGAEPAAAEAAAPKDSGLEAPRERGARRQSAPPAEALREHAGEAGAALEGRTAAAAETAAGVSLDAESLPSFREEFLETFGDIAQGGAEADEPAAEERKRRDELQETMAHR